MENEKIVVDSKDLKVGWDVKVHEYMEDSPYNTFHVVRKDEKNITLHRVYVTSSPGETYARPYVAFEEVIIPLNHSWKWEVWRHNYIH